MIKGLVLGSTEGHSRYHVKIIESEIDAIQSGEEIPRFSERVCMINLSLHRSRNTAIAVHYLKQWHLESIFSNDRGRVKSLLRPE